MARRIAMFAYPGVQILDVFGPLEVFARASRWLCERDGHTREAYTVEVIGPSRGAFRASSGLRLYADHAFRDVGRGIDTLLVAGGIGSERFVHDAGVLGWLRKQSRSVRRLASVCTGAFFLAEAGLLDGLRATTHWASCEALARQYPEVQVEPDRLFLRQGSIYTAAGVTAGIDLALALVEEDHGRDAALGVARALVMFLQRPGGQAQFSAQLSEQLADHGALRDVQGYIADHPAADLGVEALAKRAAMSPRNFARAFAREVGTTPAKFVSSTRVETARRLLEDSSDPLPLIGERSGFGTTESMRRAFQQAFGVSPRAYRERFSSPPVPKKKPRSVA